MIPIIIIPIVMVVVVVGVLKLAETQPLTQEDRYKPIYKRYKSPEYKPFG